MALKRVLAAVVLVASPLMAAAPSDAQRVAEATLALPEHLRAGATVVLRNEDGGERVLRKGSNGFVCRPDGPEPGFKVGCTEASARRYFKDVRPLVAQGSSASEKLDLIDAAVEEGTIAAPPPGSRAYVLSGPDRARAKPTLGIFLPGATAESTGLSTERADGTWLMCPGTPGAHIMVGDISYGQSEDVWKTCGR